MNQDEQQKRTTISKNRKLAYYLGMGLSGIGLVLFYRSLSASPPGYPLAHLWHAGWLAHVAGIIGFILIFIGQAIANIAKRGLAGSGVVLDPEKAREDLAPYTHMAGGMVKDVAEGFREGAGDEKKAPPHVMLRCRSCETLNPEDAKYCKQCGKLL